MPFIYEAVHLNDVTHNAARWEKLKVEVMEKEPAAGVALVNLGQGKPQILLRSGVRWFDTCDRSSINFPAPPFQRTPARGDPSTSTDADPASRWAHRRAHRVDEGAEPFGTLRPNWEVNEPPGVW